MKNFYDYEYREITDTFDKYRISRKLFITKNGIPYCLETEELIESFECFKPYLWKDMKDSFMEEMRKLCYSPIVPKIEHEDNPRVKKLISENNDNLIFEFFCLKKAYEIMHTYYSTNSWDEVYAKLKEQGHSGYSFSALSNILIQYSPMGYEFINRFAPSRPLRDKTFKPFYEKAKQKLSASESAPQGE